MNFTAGAPEVKALANFSIYLINSIPDLQRGSWRPAQYPSFRKHVALLGVFLLALWAAGYGLDLLKLVYLRLKGYKADKAYSRNSELQLVISQSCIVRSILMDMQIN